MNSNKIKEEYENIKDVNKDDLIKEINSLTQKFTQKNSSASYISTIIEIYSVYTKYSYYIFYRILLLVIIVLLTKREKGL